MSSTPHGPDQLGKPRKRLKLLVLGAAGAGKTSLLRRYFYKQFEYERMPTLGSDFYVGKVPIPSSFQPNPIDPEIRSNGATTSVLDAVTSSPSVYVNVQMWDTPGKENFAMERQRHVQYSATLSDSFFQHADAIMLVYDMTSSTSFTRLLKWYGDLMDLFAKSGKAWPILIVANKLDLYQTNLTLTQKEHSSSLDDTAATSRPVVTQRDVLGLHGKDYYGKNFHYEYQICLADENDSIESVQNGHGNVNNIANSLGGNIPGHRRDHTNKRRMEISTYLVRNRDNWTTDGSYLESLLQSEDGSHPDRDMVMLWCMRNRLRLVEVSAATGEGVSEAVEALIALALQQTEGATPAPDPMPPPRQVNDELDIHQRFSKKNDTCFFCLPSIRNCCNR